jgi:TPR repeat protein
MDNTSIKAGNWFIDQLNVYQSANSDFDSIKSNFIIRLADFEIITSSLLDKKANDPLQLELVLGRRGSGKSTLLKRIEIEIIENKKLSKKFIAINLAEEQAGIYRLFDLWEQVIEEIKHQLNIEVIIQDYAGFDNNQDYTRYLYQLINELCAKHKKRIVLLLDNFDRIVENFSDDGNLLRETLINYNDIQIIAGSTRMDEHFWRYDMPFYEFFRRHRLEALSSEEIFKLLYHWSDLLKIDDLRTFIDNNPGKIENIRILTDGLPRTLQFFIQMVLQHADSNSYDYLKKVMDNVTPLYQERLNNLPAQLRKTVLEMAFIWEACTTKQLVEKVKMESKLVSANLKTLVEKGIADKIETSKKNHLYRISERFFNMWLIVTQGNPEQKRKVKWLSIFLENWYNAADFKAFSKEHIYNLLNKKISWDKALIFSKTLSQSKYVSFDERDVIIELTGNMKDKNIKNCLIELPEKFNAINPKVLKLIEDDKYEEAIAIVSSLENEEDGLKFAMLGFLNNEVNKDEEAEKYYLLAIEKGEVHSLNNLAIFYKSKGNYDEAEKYFLLAIQTGNDTAYFNLANLYLNQERYEEAEKYYLLAIDKGEIKAFNNLALLYAHQEKFDIAIKYYSIAVEKGDVNAMNNLALLYKNRNLYSEAEKYYLMAIEGKDSRSLNNLAIFYYERNLNKEKAIEYLKNAFEIDDQIAIKQNLITIEIWNGKFNNIENRIVEIINESKGDDLDEFLLDLLIHQQKNLVVRLFQKEEFGKMLQEKYTVIYYACLLLNKSQDENLALKIPPELQATIDDVLAKINERAAFYGYK